VYLKGGVVRKSWRKFGDCYWYTDAFHSTAKCGNKSETRNMKNKRETL